MSARTVGLHRYVAFLRAINVGGRTVKMDRLRALFEALGFSGVETFIASGNVVFDAPSRDAGALERRIEAQLREGLGFDVVTFLRTPAEVQAAAAHRPPSLLDPEGTGLAVAFLRDAPPSAARERLLALRNDVDDFDFHGREVYWTHGGRMSDSTFSGAVLERTLGAPATMRNATTVRRLAAKYPVASPTPA